jgi:hypothetical protein
MNKENRIKKHKDRLHKIYANYTDRQLLEQIAYSLIIICIFVGSIVWIEFMKWIFSW